MRIKIKIPEVETYKKDKRIPIEKLYNSFLELKGKKWIFENIYNQESYIRKKKFLFPIVTFRTRKKGKSIWIISGIHGEEPAGPNAIAKNIKFLNKLAEKIPIVLIPICNPAGYVRDFRYPYQKRAMRNKIAISVSDSEHLLIGKNKKPRAKKPSCNESAAITNYIIKTFKTHKPVLVLDFHEDESLTKLYIYSQGVLGYNDPIAKEVVSILKKRGFKFYEKGKTRFNEKIINGIVFDVSDNSVDELLASKKIILNGKIKKGPGANSVIIIETTTLNYPLKKRVSAHTKILKNSEEFFRIASMIK